MSLRARSSYLALVVLSLTVVTAPAQEKAAAGQATPQSSAVLPLAAGGQYAENNICQSCHEEVWNKHFAGTPHAALLKGDQHGCQSCHGPAQAHVDGGGDVTKIIRFETLTPAQTAAICTKCPWVTSPE